MNHLYDRKVIVVQPVVPNYRKSFFCTTSNLLGNQFHVYASEVDMGVLTENAITEPWRPTLGPIRRIGLGLEWQQGAMSVQIDHGDVVVISGAPRCLTNMLLLLKARLVGAQTIWWGQLWSSTSRWHRVILRLMLMRLANSVLFYTENEVTAYKRYFGRWDNRNLGALNNGIDIKPIQILRAGYVAEERTSEILFIGRLTQKAEIKLLLKALTKESLDKVILHVIGDGPDRNILQKWSTDNKLEPRVIWHGATVDETKISQIANRSAIFCYPGAVGLSLMHGMAYGLPAVVHDIPSKHMPEIAAFEENVTGLTFKIGDVESLSNKLTTLLDDPIARGRMSQEALRRVETLYNTDSMSRRFLDFIRDIE